MHINHVYIIFDFVTGNFVGCEENRNKLYAWSVTETGFARLESRIHFHSNNHFQTFTIRVDVIKTRGWLHTNCSLKHCYMFMHCIFSFIA